MSTVQGVVQVVGHFNVPRTPRDPEALRQWYYQVRAHLHDSGYPLILPLQLELTRNYTVES